ncbi:P-selectin-like isoform X2 [Orbicella faveolata]|uniref:P-selectin-like isoform X2 n=1 Tax=Orbicella faveolata TaxID=48498 RepID=UPI0009E623EC|nr:P-selectin-like isoform X2 [Orbicella faveolata]
MLIHFKLGILIFIISTSLLEIAHSCSRRRRTCRTVHGGWSRWSPDPVDHCSCSGKVRQTRRCTNPRPSCWGNSCSGPCTRYVDCDECSCNNGGCEQICKETDAGHTCSCLPGYKRSGTSCIENRCATSDWTTPDNGVKTPQQDCGDGRTVRVNTICRAECNFGYQLEGTSTTVCTPQGNWNPRNSPRCTVKKCVPVVLPNRGQVTPSFCETGPPHGETCYFSCLDNFEVDNTQASCSNGVWSSSPVFSCVDNTKPEFTSDCPPDQSVIAEKGQTDKIVFWPPITAEDNDGQVPEMVVTPAEISPEDTSHKFSEGTHVVTFTARDLSGNSQTCSFIVEVKVLRCNALVAPPNGVLDPTNCGNLLGTKCGVKCLNGYEDKQLSPRRECEKSEDDLAYWTGEETNCTVVKCPAISVPPNVDMSGNGCQDSAPEFGTTCFFNCRQGYKRIEGSHSIVCNADKAWSGSLLQCEAVTCHPLPVDSKELSVEPASCELTNSSYGTECRFQCTSGYQLEGPSVKTCTQSGDWSFTANTFCRDVSPPNFGNSCPNTTVEYADRNSNSKRISWTEPHATDNSGVEPKVRRVGKKPGDVFPEGIHSVKYIFTDDRGNTVECSFQVTVSVMYCIPKLINPPSGRVSCSYENRFGSNCSFTCQNGYSIRGSVHRQCEAEEGKPPVYWTGNETHCKIVKCDKLNKTANVIMSGCGRASFSYGDKCLFYCEHGYKAVSGTKERHCRENGTWSGSPLTCEVVQCSSLTSPEHGHVTPSQCLNNPPYGTLCQFTCQRGYRVNGSDIRTCSSSGNWSDNALIVCKGTTFLLPNFLR